MNRRQICLGSSALAALALARPALAQAGPELKAAIDGPSRTPANAQRDPFRHPLACLTFWGLKPGMTVVEVDPGNPGYWTEILLPYLTKTGGTYIATGIPVYAAKVVPTAPLSLTSGPIAAAGTADMVLTARNIHNMMWQKGMLAKGLKDFHEVLKPGGILAVEEHRADPRPQRDTERRPADDGYVSTAFVIAQAEAAGFKLEARSEINANSKDTKDYPFGVWTLPPTREDSEVGRPPAPPGFSRAKIDAIGESDRMTLRFRKV